MVAGNPKDGRPYLKALKNLDIFSDIELARSLLTSSHTFIQEAGRW